MDIAEFLLARIAEDEAAARAGVGWANPSTRWGRVLAECEAKRRIVQLWNEIEEGTYGDQGPSVAAEATYALAAVYADHPDYQPEWKP